MPGPAKDKKHGPILVVVPTYNERGNLEEVRRRVFRALPKAHLLVVDDNSPDGTGDLADSLARRDRRIHVLHRARKQGLGTAYLAGFRWGLPRGYGLIVAMDADLSHDPALIPRMVSLSRNHALVIGSRYIPGGGMSNWGWGRLAISRSANLLMRLMLGLKEADGTAGFRCYRADLLRRIPLGKVFSPGYSFQVEMLYRARKAGASVAELPILFVNRHTGESKLNLGEIAWYFRTLLRLRLEGEGRGTGGKP